jgi:polysaccharide pyruvyl transferase WcaK-like protein
MKPVVVIISECHSENIGDQAITRSLRDILHPFYDVKEASFSKIPACQAEGSSSLAKARNSIFRRVLKSVPAKTKARIRWNILGDKRKFADHFRKAIDGSNLVLIGGGQLVKNNVALFCEKLALVPSIAGAQSIQTALIGVGVDKKMNQKTWCIARKAINTAAFIILRDVISRDRICAAMKPAINCSVLPDLAFGLKNPELDLSVSDRSVSLAINIMDFDAMLAPLNSSSKIDSNTIISGFCEIVKAAHDAGSTIRLFTSGSSSDFRAADNFRAEVSARIGVELQIFHPSTLDDLLAFLIDVDDVIATRMHAGILAFISGCNPVCFNWDDKVIGVWSAIHRHERVIDMEEIFREDFGSELLLKLYSLPPTSRKLLDDLAESVRSGVLESIDRTLMAKLASKRREV